MRAPPPGRLVHVEVDSALLRGNLLGDPHHRTLPVWLPPEYDEDTAASYPVLFYLAGYMGKGESQLGFRAFMPSLPERLAQLHEDGAIGPMIVAFPDCWTRLGGSQYIDSSVCGPYMAHLCDELVPLVDSTFRTLRSREHRGLFGKSSGGFGALVHAMLRPETWGAIAAHSSDLFFEYCFFTDFPRTINEINRAGGVSNFLAEFARRPKHSAGQTHTLMHLAMAACFDPQPGHPQGFELPFDLHTGVLREERWVRWLAWDPVRLVATHHEALKRLSLLFVDCGNRDQYHLHLGARLLHEKLNTFAVPHRYEEFPDDHTAVDYRFDRSLPLLYDAIAPRRLGAPTP